MARPMRLQHAHLGGGCVWTSGVVRDVLYSSRGCHRGRARPGTVAIRTDSSELPDDAARRIWLLFSYSSWWLASLPVARPTR